MKQKNYELDVDYIGGTEPLTKEEEKKISDFIKGSKEKSKKQKPHKLRIQKAEA